jgi:hypothetical protein
MSPHRPFATLASAHHTWLTTWADMLRLSQSPDNVAATFATPEQMARFAHSHGVPTTRTHGEADVVAHVFRETVGLLTTPTGQPIAPESHHAPAMHAARTLGLAVAQPYMQVRWNTSENAVAHVDPLPHNLPMLSREQDVALAGLHAAALVSMKRELIETGIFQIKQARHNPA